MLAKFWNQPVCKARCKDLRWWLVITFTNVFHLLKIHNRKPIVQLKLQTTVSCANTCISLFTLQHAGSNVVSIKEVLPLRHAEQNVCWHFSARGSLYWEQQMAQVRMSFSSWLCSLSSESMLAKILSQTEAIESVGPHLQQKKTRKKCLLALNIHVR